MVSADNTRFPPVLSADISVEITAIAWCETDLLRDIPDDNADAMYLATTYTDIAADLWEDRNELPHAYLPHRIVNAARLALIPRIEAEIDRRDRLVRAEYGRRQRTGLIDANGVGAVPNYYEIEEDEPGFGGHESEALGWVHPEVSSMATIARSDIIRLWHFECPECGFTDAEFGGPADSSTIHCEVCLEDGHTIRLKRWPADETALAMSRWAA